jgi:hypothetical protein
MNVEPLLGQARLDPFSLIDRVLQQILDQLARGGAIAGYGNKPPEELLGIALGNWLTGTLRAGQPPTVIEASPDGDQPEQSTHDELVERNSVLAAALGACDCWGEQADCSFCEGDGSAGWVRPDKQLFAKYVYPAVRTLPISSVTVSDARRLTEPHTTAPNSKEDGDD